METWERYGYLRGSLSEEDCANGGKWLVGDRLPEEHPGKSNVVMYKSWVARPDKYTPGLYLFQDRVATLTWEYVQVMRGTLVLVRTSQDALNKRQVPLTFGLSIDLSPEALRAWELPSGCHEARGITVLRSEKCIRTPGCLGGVSHGFCFESWAGVNVQLSRPFCTSGLTTQLVEVFGGRLGVSVGSSGGITEQLAAGDHLYLQPGAAMSWEAESPDTYGTVLYY